MHEPSGKIRKTVSFNTKNENDLPLLKQIENVENFNNYIKRLIETDIKKMNSHRSTRGGIKIVVGHTD